MKVLLVGFKLNIGNELYMKMLIQHLKQNGFDVEVCGDQGFINKYNEGIAIGHGGNAIQMVKDTISLSNYRKFAQLISRGKPDFIFFMSSHTLNNVAILLTKLFSPKSVIITQVHDPIPHSGTSYGIIIFLSQFVQSWLSSHIIIAGNLLKSVVEKYYFQPSKKLHILPLGTHRDEKELKLNEQEKIYISILGRIEDYKGTDIFLKAAMKVIRKANGLGKNFKFIIGGVGDLKKYQALIELIPEQYMEVRNYMLSNEEFDEILSKSLVCVLPYKDATQTGTVQISYYNSCPVIVTRVGSLPELVEESQTGFIIEPNNESILAERVMQILTDSQLQNYLSKQAFQYYENNLRWSKIIKKLTASLHEWRSNS